MNTHDSKRGVRTNVRTYAHELMRTVRARQSWLLLRRPRYNSARSLLSSSSY